jgi:Na+-transporting methylmalonyl-CoA/oxaloacetate decarboxylase gamma subunit
MLLMLGAIAFVIVVLVILGFAIARSSLAQRREKRDIERDAPPGV